MKIQLLVVSLIVLFLFSSCSQKPKNGKWEIKTNLVYGTINAEGTDLGSNCGGYIEQSSEGFNVTYNKGCIECDKFKIIIDTTFLSFEDYSSRYKESMSVIKEESGDDYRLFYIKHLSNINKTKVFGETISADSVFTNGYRFLLFKKGRSKNYVLEGNNDGYSKSPPISTREIAMKAMGIAKSFEPLD